MEAGRTECLFFPIHILAWTTMIWCNDYGFQGLIGGIFKASTDSRDSLCVAYEYELFLISYYNPDLRLGLNIVSVLCCILQNGAVSRRFVTELLLTATGRQSAALKG